MGNNGHNEMKTTDGAKEEEHSLLCNEALFYTGLRAAAEDTSKDEWIEQDKTKDAPI